MVKYHFSSLKLTGKHFSAEKLIGKYQISKSRGRFVVTLFRLLMCCS